MAADGELARVVRLPASSPAAEEPPTGVAAIASPADRAPDAEEANPGLTPPSRRGGSSRFLTDVIADLGLVSREQIASAVESARPDDARPRACCWSGMLTRTRSRAPSPSATASITST